MTNTPSPITLPGLDEQAAMDFLQHRCQDSLTAARTKVTALKADPPSSALEVLEEWNQVGVLIGNAAAAASLFAQVHPSSEVRGRADEAMQAVQQLSTDLGLDRELYAVFAALSGDGLDPQPARLLERTMRDFRRSGVDRDDATRDRLRALADQELKLGQEFEKNIREGTRSIKVSPDQLTGMPKDWLDAHPVDENGQITVTTDYPDLFPLRMFCSNAKVRRDLVTQALNVAWPANDELLRQLFNARDEHASLLGYDTWADYDAEVKMIGSGSAIGSFVDQIADAARERGHADKAVVLERKRQDVPDATDIDGADLTYYAELVRREQYSVDAQLVRQYFNFPAVRQGLLDVTSKLFGLTWLPVTDAGPWHEDVTSFDVEFAGARIGRIHLDLHPREGKFKHAAQFTLVSGVTGEQLPEGVLVCNFSRNVMEHGEVVTLFHEFGHLIHHVLGGNTAWSRFSGVATEWDFVEAPSQMLEEWAWDASVLQTFTKGPGGEPIPAELVAKMRAAKDFGKGFDACTQMFYAALSYTVHTRTFSPEDGEELTSLMKALQARYSVFPYIEGTHFQCGFGHLEGYTSAYYTYMWSLVIAKDMFSAFDPANLFDRAVADRYRDRVLRPGGSKDAAELVADFLGRPYTFDAYRAWLAR